MSSTDDAKTGPGTTSDPNQATNTAMPQKDPVEPDLQQQQPHDPDDPKTGPGTTSDPNQANRT